MPAIHAGMSWRRFGVLLTWLPPESAWRRIVANTPIELTSEQARQAIANM